MHLGLIGHGNIAMTLLALLEGPLSPARLTLRTRAGRAEAARAALPGCAFPVEVVDSAGALLAARPDLVVECAGHAGVAENAPTLLRAGIDVMVVSVGALADAALERDLHAAARDGGARMILPPGAVGGIDLLAALAPSGDLEVRYRGVKPPAAWAGTPAEQVVDLAGLTGATTFFEGTAREAARAYPKNANVAATLALAGAGFEATRVELVADPAAAGNIHAYEVRSALARYEMRIENLPSSGNIKTSAATIYSLLREIRNRIGPVAI